METFNADAKDTQNTLTWADFKKLATRLASMVDWKQYDALFPVLRGGLYPAVELSRISGKPIVWELPEKGGDAPRVLVVDEICDSGDTLTPLIKAGYDTATLHFCGRSWVVPTYYATSVSGWVSYPWETSKDIERIVSRQIEYIGDTTTRAGLEDTPRRVVESWEELFRGYRESPEKILTTTFPVERETPAYSPVVLRGIEFYSTCEHHLLPFFGTIDVGYTPGNRVVGISKIARLVDCFARRLQIQERLCEQIADAIQGELNPYGVYVKARARHLCMVARGVAKQNAEMVSVAARGDYSRIQPLVD